MPSEPRSLDSDELWWRVGLGELRQALKRVEDLTRTFEQVLRELPPCNTCARGSLLEQLHTASNHLGRELLSLIVLAKSLKEAVVAAEHMQTELVAEAPNPCRCTTGLCTCHD